MNVLSLFNGMSTGHTALDNVGIKVGKYYSSEIKPAAIKLTQHHYPDTIQLGDVTKWKEWDIDWKSIDIVLSGSPCQDLSIAGKREGLEGNRSSLFFVFVDILNYTKQLNPKVLFLQENVGSAPKKDVGIMSRALGVYPVRINSKLVTAQLRDRYYWSNIKTAPDGMFGDIITDIPQPKDKEISFKDILIDGYVDREKCNCILERGYKDIYKDMKKFKNHIKRKKSQGFEPPIHVIVGDNVRNLYTTEYCRLQGFPDNWCDSVTKQEAISLLGDGWTLPIIEHIFSFIDC